MDIHSLLIFQIAADVVLCVAIIYLLRVINKNIRNRKFDVDDQPVNEFRRLLDESQIFGTHFLQALEDGREVLKEIAVAVEEKEKILKALISESDEQIKKLTSQKKMTEGINSESDKRYNEAIGMARQGLSPHEIAKMSGLAEGEVALIMDLVNKRSANL
jgi:hypothetical protein